MSLARPSSATDPRWTGLGNRLAELLRSSDDLFLEFEVNGYENYGECTYFVKFTRDGETVRADTTSNALLEPRWQLTDADHRRLGELGWEAPNPRNYMRYWTWSGTTGDPEVYRKVTDAAIAVLHEIFGVSSPAGIRADGWTEDERPVQVGELGIGAHSLPWRDSGLATTAIDSSPAVIAEIARAGWLRRFEDGAARGALSNSDITALIEQAGHALSPAAALRAFVAVVESHTRAGIAPGPRLPGQLAALAAAAEADEFEVAREVLERLLPLSAMPDTALGAWKHWRRTLIRMCRDSARTRGVLLDMLPTADGVDGWWIELLTDCGAVEALTGDSDSQILPADGRAGWLSRTIQHPRQFGVDARGARGDWPTPLWPRPLIDLLPKMAAALVADGIEIRPNGGQMSGRGIDLRVMDALVAHGIPVTTRSIRGNFDIQGWLAHAEPGEDLAALAADPVFGPMLLECAKQEEKDPARLWRIPALRPQLDPPPADARHPLDGGYEFAGPLDGIRDGANPTWHGWMLQSIQDTSHALRTGVLPQRDFNSAHTLGGQCWTPLIGRIAVVAARAAAAITPEPQRVYLLALLEVWAGTVFADPDAPLRTGVAEQDPPTLGTVMLRPLLWGDAVQLQQLIELVRDHGPIPSDAEAIEIVSRDTGLSPRAAALLLGGHVRSVPTDRHGKPAVPGMTEAAARDAQQELRDLCEHSNPTCVQELWADILPADPAALWEPGGLRSVAARLAEAWSDRHGRRAGAPESTIEAALPVEQQLNYPGGFGWSKHSPGRLCRMLADPVAYPVLTTNIDRALAIGDDEIRCDYPELARDFAEIWEPLVIACRWAYGQLPAGNPVRDGIPRTLELLRARTAHPGLVLGGALVPDRTLHRLHADALRAGKPDPLSGTDYDDGAILARRRIGRGDWYLDYRPAATAHKLDVIAAALPDYARHTVEFVRWLRSPECDRLIARSTPGALPPGRYDADPSLSAPDLVTAVRARWHLDTDAAALYLQLLALARPTDRNIRTWNEWPPARHRKAQSQLTACGLVIEDKRARSGRTAFLPGAWTAQPGLESWKLDQHTPIVISDGAAPRLPIPWQTMPTQFAVAWQRVLDGDEPR